MARTGAVTIDVTVGSFSSYVAFLEGYARAIAAAEVKWDQARSWLREAIRSARAEVRYAADQAQRPSVRAAGRSRSGGAALTVSFPSVRSERSEERRVGKEGRERWWSWQ